MSQIDMRGIFWTGQKTIGTTAGQLTTDTPNLINGVLLKADSGNASVWVGVSTVASGTGYLLKASETLELELTSPDKVYVLGSATGQKIYWVAT